MIKLILKGGLGNQMFQYAAGLALAKKNNTNLVIDLSFMENRIPIPGFTYRDYELDLFGLDLELVRMFNVEILDKYFSYPVHRFITAKVKGSQYYYEKDPYYYDPAVIDLNDGAVLDGYFNNVKYFKGVSSQIKKDFNLDKFYDKRFSDFEKKISACNSVSINIRRGDYTNKKHKGVFVQLDTDYYKKAIKTIKKKVKSPHFFVFSYDDQEWFGQEVGLPKKEFTMVGREYTGDQFKTYLRLISLCKHNIISNSTFAFWGAYLNKNRGKIVICPKKWSNIWADFEVPAGWTSF